MGSEVGYKKEYRMREVVPGRKHITVAIPYEVVQRQAEILGITVGQFLKDYLAVAEYNNFDGIRYTFRRSDVEKQNQQTE